MSFVLLTGPPPPPQTKISSSVTRRKYWKSCLDIEIQESPAWTQEAYRPPRNKFSLCCSVFWWRGGGRYPHPVLMGERVPHTPIQSWLEGGYPHPVLTGVPLSSLYGGIPSPVQSPIQSWPGGMGSSLDGGTPIQFCQHPGEGGVPYLTDWVGYPILPDEGGGLPPSSWLGVVPPSFLMGGTPSCWQGGTPIWPMGGTPCDWWRVTSPPVGTGCGVLPIQNVTPQSGLDGGIPHPDWIGVPPVRDSRENITSRHPSDANGNKRC